MITDELREWVRNHVAELNIGGVNERDLKEIADRIDEQHRRALERVAAMVDEPNEIERRVKALEHLTEGMLLAESEMEGRISMLERKLNHKGER